MMEGMAAAVSGSGNEVERAEGVGVCGLRPRMVAQLITIRGRRPLPQNLLELCQYPRNSRGHKGSQRATQHREQAKAR